MPIGFHQPASMDVEFYYNSGAGWVLATTMNYYAISRETYLNERVTLVVDGMGPWTDFGMDYVILQGNASASPVRVEWYETTVPTEHSATPSGASAVPFIAIAGT